MKKLIPYIFLLNLFLTNPLFGLDIFVAPEGNDGNPGTREKPLATLKGARDAIRGLRAKEAINEQVNVIILEGEYFMNEPLRLTEEDAATAEHPVVFMAAPGKKVVFSGGVEISGFKKVNDKLWMAKIPEVTQYGWYFEQLFVNGRRAVRARTPNVGHFFKVKKVEETIIHRGTGRAPEFSVMQIMTDTLDTRWLKEEQPENLKNALVTFYHHWDNTRKYISAFNEENFSFYIVGSCLKPWNPINHDSRYYIENLKTALDEAGEWFLEKDGTLYYIPMPGEQLEETNIIAPLLDQFIIIKGNKDEVKLVSNISFRNLKFEIAGYKTPVDGNEPNQAAANIESVVMVDYAKDIEFDQCEIAHTGLGGIWFREATRDCKVTQSYLYDLGAGGIKIGPLKAGDEGAAISKNIIADNNIIRGGGWIFPCAVGIIVFQGSDNIITHNEIADFRYTGISVGWIWGYDTSYSKRNIVKYNHIHHLGWGDLSDMGGVYTLGKSEGTEVSNNIIHHVYSLTYGGWGLYTDEGSTGVVMENNLVYNCKSSGFHQHYGMDNIIRNNIFANNIKAQLQATRVEDHNSLNFTNNIIYFNIGKLFHHNWDSINFTSDKNLYWYEGSGNFKFGKYTFKEWQKKGLDQHSIIADPGFVNAGKHDFRLKKSTAASKIGFKPFDYSKVGVYGSNAWKDLAKFDPELEKKFDRIVEDHEGGR
ncbi:MAG: right-handed parallel beta-helix repeat-containing protein [Bacteroidota bacterium]|nr:right-handed parallel beta-helix repeat-containing protein [Bacteroidota bacterium]